MPNRLAAAASPYLLQHQDNPVDWHPWGPEAFARAKAEDKPIFLSIGYSACHWCHVMAHESFESDEIARQLNADFVSIKVDREERPDLDHIYMAAVQAISGRGGWPMSVFLTPDGQPFFGGTYWPPERRMGMPGFDEVLRAVADLWQNRRPAAIEQAEQLTAHVRQLGNSAEGVADSTGAMGSLPPFVRPEFSVQQIATAVASLERVFDFTYGGFGGAPKFPHAMDLQLLMRYYLRERRSGVLDMVRKTLDQMAGGGIYDHLGGGFHRYSVDRQWLVPHFEKMLYDNALLARTYVDAWRLTADPEYAAVVRGTLDYLLNEMQDEAGGFYSTQDADSEGVEGKFFVWTPSEIRAVLGDDFGERFCRIYDVTEAGNFEDHNILNLSKTLHQWTGLLNRPEDELRRELADARAKLLAVRRQRIAPGLDNKVLVFWNALAIDALVEAAGALDEPRYLDAANRAADFIWRQMRRDDGRLWHVWRGGTAHGEAFLDDYAGLIQAMVTLYEASFREELIDRAVSLGDVLLRHFLDKSGGGFFFTADDHEQLIARQKPLTDESVPSGNGLAATALLRLSRLTGRHDFVDAAIGTLTLAAPLMRDYPQAAGQLLLALDFQLGPAFELVLLGDPQKPPTAEVLAELRHRLLPPKVVACRDVATPAGRSAALDSLFEGRKATANNVTLYICENYACQEPAAGQEACMAALNRLASNSPSPSGRGPG